MLKVHLSNLRDLTGAPLEVSVCTMKGMFSKPTIPVRFLIVKYLYVMKIVKLYIYIRFDGAAQIYYKFFFKVQEGMQSICFCLPFTNLTHLFLIYSY